MAEYWYQSVCHIIALIDRSPFRHLMKYTQRNFTLYSLGLSTVSKLVWFFFGLGLMLYVLKLFHLHSANPEWCSG